MIVLKDRNVNHVFPAGVELAFRRGVKTAPRGLETLEVPVPVTSVYERPTERVLFDHYRDANPFFHLMEALWILAGRRDVEWLAQFNSNIANYSDNGIHFHGAYGYRLRKQHGDQLWKAITKLRNEPNTRQVVLQIWDTEQDLDAATKDVPCNDLIFLKIRDGALHMTVCNRSNDIIWGCYGANAVQFSVLLEYMAAQIGVNVGRYSQVSDSFHVYTNVPKFEYYSEMRSCDFYDPYEHGVAPYKMITHCAAFDMELNDFMEGRTNTVWHNRFFPDVAIPMKNAYLAHKYNKTGATFVGKVAADDWRLACLLWLERRGDKLNRTLWRIPAHVLQSFRVA